MKVVPQSAPDDEVLAQRLRDGDEAALGILFARYKDLVFRVVRRHVDRDADALDLTQRVFLSALEAHGAWLARLRGKAPLKAYLLRIAVNAGKNFKRDRARWRLSPVDEAEGLADGQQDLAALLQAKSRQEQVLTAVEKLPSRQREVLLLRVDGDLPFKEISAALGITESNAKSNYHHAVKRLQQLVGGF